MTRDEAVAEIKQLLGFRTTLDDTIVTQMQREQARLETAPIKPWFMTSANNYRYTEVGVAELSLPTDFIEEYEDGALWLVDDTGAAAPIPLVKDDYDHLRPQYVEQGEPEYYALVGESFHLFPTPDEIYRLEMIYLKRDTALTTNIENNWLKYCSDLLVGQTGMKIAQSLRDTEAVKVFMLMRDQGLRQLHLQNEARMHANRSYQIGGDHV